MENLWNLDNDIAKAIHGELLREEEEINLIASENYVSPAVLAALGSIFTNKYAEGYPGRRFYRGCQWVDRAESLAIERARELFGAEHANVQPHSGSQANMAVYFSFLQPGDTILAMNLNHGGHLTHGHKINFSGKLYHVVSYGVDPDTELIDYDHARRLAREHRPRLIIAGASAYPRVIHFDRFREIADEVGAYLMADIAHIAGLIVAGYHPDPIPYAEFVTVTTHKTMRGPRGGMILCREEFARKIDRNVFPGIQGGPLMHVIAAKAVALKEAQQPAFKEYQRQIILNTRALAESLQRAGFRLVSGGSDNHLLLVDLRNKGISGKEAALTLERAGICCNRNLIPFDPSSAAQTSGIRLGTPAVTTRGMKEEEMKLIGGFIAEVVSRIDSDKTIGRIKKATGELTEDFPIYPRLRNRWEPRLEEAY
ncbi:MAG: serine hydroxymethyltransferase [Candidatus Euphemobacter frigidus]|nr:serine hydroxymethyltransferase [Candidatus Euphemobacter frigidus]MDP8276524.1 serine hydroxymethyltransferase [Candidatus Euphemobacter frigidus]